MPIDHTQQFNIMTSTSDITMLNNIKIQTSTLSIRVQNIPTKIITV